MKLEKLTKLAKDKKIEFIDLKFVDLPGLWHHITIPVSALDAGLFKSGVGVDGSSLPGYAKIERGDMLTVPIAETAFIDPFFERPTLSFICDIMDSHDKVEPYSRNPRRVAAFAEKYLAKTKPGLKAIMGPEFEFYLFNKVNFYQGPDQAFYYLDSREAEWNAAQDEESLGAKIPYKKGYHAAPPMDRSFNLRSEISSMR